jgi:serine/threonine-protein kinase
VTAEAPDRLERLFRAARLHPPAEQGAFLAAACPDDDALRAEVEDMLALDAEAEAEGFLDHPATGLLGDDPPEPAADPLVGQAVGPYRVLRPLGRGGMGTVYLAVREVPFVRYVALKVVHGLASAEALARFEQERQILAGLDHAGIARLLDGGVTEPLPGAPGGLPYFAMEYVEGRPITDHCDRHRLGVGARLALFAQVCEAVHYAHQNLVLHRDLKPSNVLVTAEGGPGGGPRVKLLDFGIAKLLNPALGALAAPVTRAPLRPLTPEYASPEQARGEGLTTASDVYSLGVVLYELLAGRRPYEVAARTPEAVARTVTETEPERPSTRAARDEGEGDAARTAAETARQRDATPDRLRRALRGDLDAIVLKALRKEPGRRYASAEALAQDLDRHRRGLPVAARGDARRYRLATLVRRHRAATAAAAAVLVAVVAFALHSQGQARRLAAERDRAETARASAEAVSGFLVGLFEQADPAAVRGDTLTVREVLEAGAARVEAELGGQPEVQATVLHTIGQAHRGLGRDRRARPLLERAVALRRAALGRGHAETLDALFDLGRLYEGLGETERAGAAYEEVLAQRRRALGETDPALVLPLYHLALVRHMTGRHGDAARLFDEWEALLRRLPDRDGPLLAEGLTDYADYLITQDRHREAEGPVRRALAMRRRLHGETSPEVGATLNRLAQVLAATGRPREAEAAAREALALHERLYPDGHRQLGDSLRRLAEALQRQGRHAAADALLRRDLALRRRLHGDAHTETAGSLARLGRLHHGWGRLAEAERQLRAAVATFADLLGPGSLTVIRHRQRLADVLVDAGRYAEAERVLLADYGVVGGRGPDDEAAQAAAGRLARLYEVWGRPEAAGPYRAHAGSGRAAGGGR